MTTPTRGRLYETCWEVCNKVGGMYTVVTSKLAHVQADYGSNYLAIGPYLSANNPEFREEPVPNELSAIVDAVTRQGITVHYGRWEITGQPAVVLLEWQGLLPQLNSLKSSLWERYQLDTLGTDFYDVDQPLLWSTAVGMFCRAAAEHDSSPLTVQVHEWMSGGTILHLDDHRPDNVRTTFTTHATVLGRALCSHNVFIYSQFGVINPDEEARRIGVQTKHQIEKLAANRASAFTTVSKITAEESEAFLGRKPDVIVENGLDLEDFLPFDTLSWHAHTVRSKIEVFLEDYFAASYELDAKQYTLQCTMGRYEVRNKGYDLYIQALGQLNQKLKETPKEKGVIALFFVPGDVAAIRPETSLLVSLHGTNRQAARHLPAYAEVPTSPYILRQGPQEAITALLRENGLLNREEDRVKVVFFAAYFNGLDGIFNEHIYSLVSACDLGVFPSLYEPWGYTPLESLALGVPTVTSDLAGFGRAIHRSNHGTFILDRRQSGEDVTVTELVKILKLPLTETPHEWAERRIAAYHTARHYGWDRLYGNYQAAYHLAWQAP